MTTPLNDLIRDAADLKLQGGGIDAITETAVALAAHIRDAQAALEPLKEMIRDLARVDRAEEGGHHVGYEAPNGRVSVTFPKQRYEARKGMDWAKARKSLGSDFDVYFTTVTTVRTRPDINDLLSAEMERLHDGNAEEILQFVELDEPTPRVGFKPDPS